MVERLRAKLSPCDQMPVVPGFLHRLFGNTTFGMDAEKPITEMSSIGGRELERKLKEQEESLWEEFKKDSEEQLHRQQEQLLEKQERLTEQQRSVEAKMDIMMDAMMAHTLTLKEK
ncbi:hypothetical protein BG011_007343 [Mortierella polycephala]|uniref:Uncharacterized protein n=1 Tax=Mortierella polycephala TaxID=41804 RepID=A0A9P6PTS0_9FUNG|nr:hypothetical protein BG011_007343 [Mortierella polycephala]